MRSLSSSLIFSDFFLSLFYLSIPSLSLSVYLSISSLSLSVTNQSTSSQLRSQIRHSSDHRSTAPITSIDPQLRSSIHSSDHRSTAPITSIDPQLRSQASIHSSDHKHRSTASIHNSVLPSSNQARPIPTSSDRSDKH